jgi:hypothetical protein
MKSFLLACFAALLRVVAIDRTRSAARRLATAVLLGFGAALAGLGALLCLLAALWLYVSPNYGPVAATLLVAGILLLIMLALLLAIPMTRRQSVADPIVIAIPSLIPSITTADIRLTTAELMSAAAAGFLVGFLRAPKRTDGG